MTDGTFEGAVSLQVKGGGRPSPQSVDYLIKGDRMRVHVGGSDSYVVLDWKDRKGYTITDQRKLALPMDLGRIAARMSERQAPPVVLATGQLGTVAGYGCEEIEVTITDKKIGACAVRGIGWFGGNGPASFPLLNPDAGKFFPLRLVEKDATGAEVLSAEAIKIERTPVDDAVFAVPSDYRVIVLGTATAGASSSRAE